jgi:dephospho-CoA kinase
MTFLLGLTGSIGMGKSTTARMFADAGIPLWDADAAVHRLYEPGQPAALAVARLFPGAMGTDGRVDRAGLRAILQADSAALDRLNQAVHPIVGEDRLAFLARHQADPVVVLDIPLLFETGLDRLCDAVAVVSAPVDQQRQRVLARGMTEADLALILSRQMPDAEKRSRANYVIPTTTLEGARGAVKDVLADIQKRIAKDA